MNLPPEMVAILAAFAPLFSDRSWIKAQTLAIGAILTTGNHTVCAALRAMGLSHERHFTNYHRVLNRDVWSCLTAGQVLLALIVAVIPAVGPSSWPPMTPSSAALADASGPGAATAIPCGPRASMS